ncbi:MAG TPA: hypothetical protein IAC80_01575 [Candidatus Merdiplasma excrementigallinarum]|uniref:Uncharacterized protein n=1 Tax=Candidatus Merdiplasma excrementigallinarum TaxID=2840864 RepID=A0A9D1NYC0_9FIRM|nr:hypothetical protein [Candidatus Merdiplasma excrementigallinarum]
MRFYIGGSIRNRKIKNLITIGVGMALVLLLCLYFGTRSGYEKQLNEFAATVPIRCQVTNISGSRETGLFISDRMVQGVMESDLTKEVTCMVWLMAGEGEFEPEDWAGNINLYVDGANRVEAVPGLTEDLIHLEEGTIQEFFSSDQLECVVNQQTCEERGWKVGDEISLNFFYFMADNATMTLSCYTNPLELARVKIVGTMEDLTTATGAVSPDVVLPLETVRSMFDRNGVSFMADTLSFQVSDPLRLNEFKEEMKGLGFMEREAGSMDSYSGIALAVDDSSFLSMARNLQFAMDTMTAFLPAVLALAALVGYVVSSLLAGSRSEEYALLRLMGIGRFRSSIGFWAEQAVLVLAGIAAGDLLAGIVYPGITVILLADGMLLGAYLLGAAAAYWRMGRGSVMELAQEIK